MKKLEKKLRLNRETVCRLDPRELAAVNGAVVWTGCMSECTECGTIQYRQIDGAGTQ